MQALALILLVAVAVATVIQLAGERRLIIADTERQMSRLDMVFAEQTGRAVETVDLIVRNSIDALLTVTKSPELQQGFNETLARRIAGVQPITALLMLNADGTIRYSAGPLWQVLPEAVKLALAWHQANPAGLRIGPPLRDANGGWVALLTRPIIERGQVSGIGIALLNLGYFEEFYRAVELNENGSIILHLRDGTVLARFPHIDAAIGTSFGHLPPFTEVLAKSTAGTLLMESPLDGSIRVTAIRALKAFPLAVMVSVEQGRLLQDWRREAWLFGTAATLVAVVMSGLIILLAQRSRQIDRLVDDIDAARVAAETASEHMRTEMAERERAEAALRETQRIEAVGRLTGGVAHDFNNLLTVVMGNVDLLLRTLPDDGTQDVANTRLTAIREAAQKGATLTAHLLAFARRQPLMPRPTDLNDIIQGMTPLITSALGRRIRLEPTLAPDLWPAVADPTQIELAILNLVMNARDAMPQGGVTYIRTVNRVRQSVRDPSGPLAGDYVAVIVSDTGSGMPPEIAARAVEPFFTTKAPGTGSGLGLSHVLGTARQLGGDLTIDSTPGQGTSVSLLLPRAASNPTAGDGLPDDVELPETEGLPILLVDDDEAARVVTGELLRSMGYRVAEAPNGEAALRLLERGLTARVLVTDLSMPGMDGSRLAAAARMLRPSIGVVIVSGHSDLARLAQGRGAHRVMRKPFQPEELHRQISLALAEREGVTTVTV